LTLAFLRKRIGIQPVEISKLWGVINNAEGDGKTE
jgi:hypothetical protein